MRGDPAQVAIEVMERLDQAVSAADRLPVIAAPVNMIEPNRVGRGVYYTPPPIVNLIVRAIDDILKDRFGIRDGLADHRCVTVLDFACGTGTFLLEVCQQIFANIGGPDSGRAI